MITVSRHLVHICFPSVTTVGDHQAFGLHGVFTVRTWSTVVSHAGKTTGTKATKLNAQIQKCTKDVSTMNTYTYKACTEVFPYKIN